jgi:uncharacterized membrane protein YfcA
MLPTDDPSTVRAGGRIPRCATVGVVAGFLSGPFGVGGGMLIVPDASSACPALRDSTL